MHNKLGLYVPYPSCRLLEMPFTQLAKTLECWLELAFGVDQSTVRKLVDVGVREMRPVDSLHKWFANGQAPE